MANIDSRAENNNFCAIQFDYFRGMEAEQYSFYRIPKVLFTAECFQTLSCEAKVLYGLMLDRMSLSIKNRWLDGEDRVYIIFTVDEVTELMNCGTQKAVKLMKELDSEKGIGLIEKKRLGLGRPNVIYVKNFLLQDMKKTTEKENSISEQLGDVSQFKNGENHNSEIVKTTIQEVPESSSKNNENHNSGMMKKATQELGKSQSNKTEKNDTERNKTDSIPSYLINQTDITFQYLDGDENSLWSLLLAVGYIKADNVKKCGEITECDVSVTNQEVMEMFRYEILAMFENGNAVYHDFVEALLSHRTEDLTDILMDISYTSMSYFDVGRRPSERAPENFYHGLVLGLIVSLRDRYRIVSNRESGRGRYDIAMYPLNEWEDAFIIEFKVCDEKEDGSLEKAAENALCQIEEKRYDADLLAAGIAEEHIYKLGIAFAGKDVAVKSAGRVDEELL